MRGLRCPVQSMSRRIAILTCLQVLRAGTREQAAPRGTRGHKNPADAGLPLGERAGGLARGSQLETRRRRARFFLADVVSAKSRHAVRA